MCKNVFIIVFCFLIVQLTNAESKLLFSKPDKITIYWDSSFSMKDKDIAKEIDFLDNYFKIVPDVEVEFISFNTTIDIDRTFQVINADWSMLKQILLKINYDGIAFFNLISENNGSDINFLFTDGLEIIDRLNIKDNKQTYIINSSTKANSTLLKQQSISSKGNYIDLSKISMNEGLKLLQMDISNIVLSKTPKKEHVTLQGKSSNEKITLRGKIFSQDKIIIGATISNKNKTVGVISDENGEFEIQILKNDTIVVAYMGMDDREILITEPDYIEIFLNSTKNLLEEVVVKSEINNDETVNTGFGKLEKKRLGYTVQTIKGQELEGQSNVSDATRGKIIAYKYEQNDDLSQIQLRQVLTFGYGTKNPLMVVDEVPMGVNDSSTGKLNLSTIQIDPNNIENITVLRGLAATNRYGSLARGGAILITTKTATSGRRSKSKKPIDQALKRDNNYNENLTIVNNSVNENYISELKNLKSVQEIYSYYFKQRNSYSDDIQYFTNVSGYVSQWGNKELSTKILSNILEIDSKGISNLKYAALTFEHRKNFIMAEKIYEKIALLKPNEAQSYRDLALIYQETKQYQKAFDIYKNIQNNKYPKTNFSGLQKNINSEMRRLILLHGNELNKFGISNEYNKPLQYDARIVFDWNDRNADFELQFVNPQKKFFTWSHTKSQNASRIYRENSQGFNSEEFLLIDAEKGRWLINIESNIKKKKTPSVIKYTVYRNFGKSNETTESKLLILDNLKGKKMLGLINIK